MNYLRLANGDSTDGEEQCLFSARLMEEGDSSGFIYQSRNDDSGMLMAS